MSAFYVYLYLRSDASPYYVGKGTDRRVWKSHRGHRPPRDRSRVQIIRMPDEATAFAYERYLIDFWGRKNLGTGCLRNLTDGGEGPSNPSEITREKMRNRKLGKKRGKRPEKIRKQIGASLKVSLKAKAHRMKLQESRRGKPRPLETRRKISDGLKDRKIPLETRFQMSSTHKARAWNKKRTPEFNLWCGRKRLAVVQGIPFTEPKPVIYKVAA